MQESGTSLGAIFHGQSLHKRAVSTFSFAHLGSQLSFTPSCMGSRVAAFVQSLLLHGAWGMQDGKKQQLHGDPGLCAMVLHAVGTGKVPCVGNTAILRSSDVYIAQMSHLHHCTLGEPARKSPYRKDPKDLSWSIKPAIACNCISCWL